MVGFMIGLIAYGGLYNTSGLSDYDYILLYEKIRSEVLTVECEVKTPERFPDSSSSIYEDPEMAQMIIIDNLYIKKSNTEVIIDPYGTEDYYTLPEDDFILYEYD